MLNGCYKVVRSEINFIEPENVAYNLGPLFLPENPFFSSISINYFTPTPLPTKVLFTMVGDIDWLREEKSLKNFHRMTFSDLEENAVYRFEYFSRNEQKKGLIKTLPYGSEYEFSFCITSLEYGVKSQNPPSFTIVVSKESLLRFEDFVDFYERNKDFLSSTIFLPVFNVSYQNKNLFAGNGEKISCSYYKDVRIICIRERLNDYDCIASFIPTINKAGTHIIAGNIGKDDVYLISKKFSPFVEKIFVYKDSYVEAEKVVSIDSPIFITVSRDSKYAINLKMQLSKLP
ncbi:MAG: hypothetical protein ACP5QT_03220 [Brevinematia bacterium]